MPDRTTYCGLCGNTQRLRRARCCGRTLCCDQDSDWLEPEHKTCMQNHDRYTICGSHCETNECLAHGRDWKTCSKCTTNWSGEKCVLQSVFPRSAAEYCSTWSAVMFGRPPTSSTSRAIGCATRRLSRQLAVWTVVALSSWEQRTTRSYLQVVFNARTAAASIGPLNPWERIETRNTPVKTGHSEISFDSLSAYIYSLRCYIDLESS